MDNTHAKTRAHTPTHPHTPYTQKLRWSVKMDSARLLSVMFGTDRMRKGFILSKQPLTRAELDNRIKMNKHEQYWHDVSVKFSDPDVVVELTVSDATVYSYLQAELDTTYRRVVSAGECQRQYNTLRVSYEKSKSVINYKQSGQGNPNFFPAFCEDNPIHVYFHYLMRDDKEKTGNGDLSLAVFSMMDPRKHVNSMPMPGASAASASETIDVDDDVPSSSDNQQVTYPNPNPKH